MALPTVLSLWFGLALASEMPWSNLATTTGFIPGNLENAKVLRGSTVSLQIIKQQVGALRLACSNWTCAHVATGACQSFSAVLDDIDVALWQLCSQSLSRLCAGLLLVALRCWVSRRGCSGDATDAPPRCDTLVRKLLQCWEIVFARVIIPLWWVFLYLWFGAIVMEALEAPGEVRDHNEYVVLAACLQNHTRPDVFAALARPNLPDPSAYPWMNWDFFGSYFFCYTLVTTIGYGDGRPARAASAHPWERASATSGSAAGLAPLSHACGRDDRPALLVAVWRRLIASLIAC